MVAIGGIDHNELRETENLALVLSRIEARFRIPGRLDDMLEVTAELSQLSAVRFVFDQAIRRTGNDRTLLCRAVAEVACVDTRTGKPRRLPAQFFGGLHEGEFEA